MQKEIDLSDPARIPRDIPSILILAAAEGLGRFTITGKALSYSHDRSFDGTDPPSLRYLVSAGIDHLRHDDDLDLRQAAERPNEFGEAAFMQSRFKAHQIKPYNKRTKSTARLLVNSALENAAKNSVDIFFELVDDSIEFNIFTAQYDPIELQKCTANAYHATLAALVQGAEMMAETA